MMSLLSTLFPNRNDRQIKRYTKRVFNINNHHGPIMARASDDELKATTLKLKAKLNEGQTLDDILEEAFALVREASSRILGLRHYDVQLIGGMILHEGKIAEMSTGEGKTLVATLPAYLNALNGQGVHIITVNPYLVERDQAWMKPLYDFLGLTVGCILPHMQQSQRKQAYRCDIVYGSNNELAFDYLRDNMAYDLNDRVQAKRAFALVDEVDSILIDEARTPLIISGSTEESSHLYTIMIDVARRLKVEAESCDLTIDEKEKQVHLTEQGQTHAEALMIKAKLIDKDGSLYDQHHIHLLAYLNAALRALHLYQKDIDYMIKDKQAMIIDEHTGRVLEGRRWSEGLHQSIEAKEKLPIQQENQTLACITFQNYFRLYDKLSGMTGTADTEATEFQEIYSLEVLIVPSNKTNIRDDIQDSIFMTYEEKIEAIIDEIKTRHTKGQPILVGTTSIESSEKIAQALQHRNIKHHVLNAKHHEKEAHIIAQAGKPFAITIATNMAGRGTDIILGGNIQEAIADLGHEPKPQAIEAIKQQWKLDHEKVLSLGGLFVLGTERHESRRIDNQLRGRCARQGDPGSTRFFLCLQDPLLRIFASDKMSQFIQSLSKEKGVALQAPMLTRAIENAQRKVEGFHFDIRKQLLKFDDAASDQRRVIYEQREHIMIDDNICATLISMQEQMIGDLIERFLPQDNPSAWDIDGLQTLLAQQFHCYVDLTQHDDALSHHHVRDAIIAGLKVNDDHKKALIDAQDIERVAKAILLQTLDWHWKEHLAAIEHLKQSIQLRSYAQKNPMDEFKRESFEMFNTMLDTIGFETLSKWHLLQPQKPEKSPSNYDTSTSISYHES